MRSRTVLFVVLAVVLALGGVYIGWSTSSPKAAADAPATPPSSLGPAQEAGSTRSRSPGTAAPNGTADKGSAVKGSTDKGVKDMGATDKEATESSVKPDPPPSSQPQRPTGPVRFGRVTTAGRPNEINVSDDRRALSAGFYEFEAIFGPASAEPSVTKTFSMTLPLTDGGEGETLRFHAQGFVGLMDGVKARLTLKGGRRTIIKGFAPGSDEPFLETLELPATPDRTYQLSAVIEIHKDAGSDGQGYFNINAIEVEIS